MYVLTKIKIFRKYFKVYLIFIKLFLLLCRASLVRSAPIKLPQVRKEARVDGRCGAMQVACPLLFRKVPSTKTHSTTVPPTSKESQKIITHFVFFSLKLLKFATHSKFVS